MTILHAECVRDCDGQPFDFANRNVAGCDDIPVLAAGTNVTITGAGTQADPLVVAANPPAADGSETVIVAGANTTVTGSGTAADPYVVAASGPGAAPDGSETKVQGAAGVTVTGSGTAAAPYLVAHTPAVVTNAPATGPAAAPGVDDPLWQTSVLGERWHYIAGIGWKPLADLYSIASVLTSPIVIAGPGYTQVDSVVLPRSGVVNLEAFVRATVITRDISGVNQIRGRVTLNGVEVAFDDEVHGVGGYSPGNAVEVNPVRVHLAVSAGDTLALEAGTTRAEDTVTRSTTRLAYAYQR